MTTVVLEAPVAWSVVLDDGVVAVHAVGDTVAVATAVEGATILREGQVLRHVRLDGGALAVALSPDATRVALAGPSEHALASVDSDAASTTETGAWSAAVRWAGNDRVAIASGRRALVLDAAGAPLWVTAPAPSTVTDLLWLRKGRRLAMAAYGGVLCHEKHTVVPVEEYSYLGSHLALTASPSGAWLCSGNQDASVHIWRTRDGDDLTMNGYRSKISRLAFDDTGRWMVCDGAPEATVWDFSGKGPAGTHPRSLPAHERITALAWQPGKNAQVATGGSEGRLAFWTADAGRPGDQLRPARAFDLHSPVVALAWSGADRLIVATENGRVAALATTAGRWG
ncbi:MAG: WD40 repeat domain-containing protein [Sporichthyaceae bacterium]